jgi:predicted flap endonuclease-1-like 5' DNA nuclease
VQAWRGACQTVGSRRGRQLVQQPLTRLTNGARSRSARSSQEQGKDHLPLASELAVGLVGLCGQKGGVAGAGFSSDPEEAKRKARVRFLPDESGPAQLEVGAGERDRLPGPRFFPSSTAPASLTVGAWSGWSSEEKDLLSFLKSFRYIMETAETMDQKLAELAELSTSTPANRRAWQKARASDPRFPDSFFYGELCRLPGVGPKVAEMLYRSGFRGAEEIRAASNEDLLTVEVPGKSLPAKRKAVQDHFNFGLPL